MTITINKFSKRALLFCLLLVSLAGNAQQFTLTLANQTSTATTFRFDLMLTVPTGGARVASVSTGVNFNAAILNGGTPATTAGTSFILVPGSPDPIWSTNGGLNPLTTTYRGPGTPQLRIVQVTKNPNQMDLPAGVYRVGTFQFTNTTSWTANSNANLWMSPTAANPNAGGTNSAVGFSAFGSTVSPLTQTTTANGILQLTHTLANTFSVPLNSNVCAASAASSNLVNVTPCANATNGSATITLSPVPSTTTATYTVDGGGVQNATLTGGAFNITGLSAGSHTVVVTPTGCSAVTAPAFTISGTPLTTDGSMSATACDSYTWSAQGGNGTTYTASGTYTNTVGCNTATLTLTINNSSTSSLTATACDSYTWSAAGGNGTTYTTSGTYTNTTTNASGCPNVATLVLTINNSSTSSLTATACDSYTWSEAGGNGTTYTTSGTYTNTTTNASGCPNVATLVLTINNSSTSSLTATACDSYTWNAAGGNGTTYTTSGTYTNTTTNASGCPNVATLVLTINNSSTTTETIAACDTYTWAVNGQNYTTSGTYTANNTNASGCPNVATLVLTINSSSTTTETQTACNSYTWAVNGVTYTASGTYTANNTNASGCPNVATLNLTINSNTTPYYTDADSDGFGTGTAIFSCTGQPAGTALVSGDCAPNDPTRWRTANLYVDSDNDGYYNGNPETTPVCYGTTLPSGYTSTIIGTDCDDANAEANPNHVEILGNTIDDNCDGTIDEVGPSISLIPSQCNNAVPLANIAATIYSQQAAGAEGYRFEVTNGSTVRTYDSATNSFSLLSLPGGAAYATTYSIRVAVKTAGFWRNYTSVCTVTTPAAAATTNVIASQCGTTLSNIDTTIYVNQVTAANQYRFEVTDTANASNVRTYDSSLNRFSLSNLAGGGAFATTYSVRVALRFGTTWEPYGTACNVTTPATPGITSLQASQCNITISNRWTTLYATQVPSAQGYRFRVTNGATVRFVDRIPANFALGQLTGAPLTPNTAYTVEVAVLYNSVYGAFGPACTITTAGVITRHADAPVAIFDVKSYPNPFADTFKLDINTSSEDNVGVKVYDMIGKLVESRDINVSELGTIEVGSRYSSGVYNVIVSQGANVKTLRVIKR